MKSPHQPGNPISLLQHPIPTADPIFPVFVDDPFAQPHRVALRECIDFNLQLFHSHINVSVSVGISRCFARIPLELH
jgi:hypothetical protein